MTEEDIERRRLMWTASEVATVFGLHPHLTLTEVIGRKRGEIEPRQETPEMRAGKLWQEAIHMVYQKTNPHLKVEWCDQLRRHPDHPWLGASPDALVTADREVIEYKWVHWTQRHKYGYEPYSLPQHHTIQTQVQMGVWGYPRAKVVVMAGESTLRIYPQDFDPLMFAAIVKVAHEAYLKYVTGTEKPPITGSEESGRWLQRQFPQHFSDIREATAEERELLEQYTDACIREKTEVEQYDYQRDLLENQIKECIAESEGLKWFGGRFTWKRAKDSMGVDWEKVADTVLLKLPEEERKELRERLAKQFPTVIRKGTRRIHFTSDRLAQAPSGKEIMQDAERGIIAGREITA